MANITYDSPASLAPSIGFKPEGFLGGMAWDQRNQDYSHAVDQSNLMQTLGTQGEINKLQQYQQEAPVRAAKNLSDIATSNANATNIGEIKAGEAATGRMISGTAKEKMANDIATWKANQDKWSQEHIDRQMSNMEAVGNAFGFNPDRSVTELPGHDTLEGQAHRAALLEHFKKQFPDLPLPQQWDQNGENQMFQHYQAAKVYKEVEQKRALAKQATVNETGIKEHEIDAASRERVSENMLKWRQKVADIQETKTKGLDIEIGKMIKKQNENKTKGIVDLETDRNLADLQDQKLHSQVTQMLNTAVMGAVMSGNPMTAESIAEAAVKLFNGLKQSKGQGGLPPDADIDAELARRAKQ